MVKGLLTYLLGPHDPPSKALGPNRGTEKKMETTIIGYIGLGLRV